MKKKSTKKKAAKKSASASKAVKKKRPDSKPTKAAAKKESRKRPQKVIDYAVAKRAINRYGEEIRSLPGVTHVDVGLRFKGGKPTNTITLRLHVKTQEEKQYLKDNADELGLQREYGGIGSDIIVRGAVELASKLDDGSRIRVKDGGIGTIATTVRANIDGDFTKNVNVYITDAHVIAPRRPSSNVVLTDFDSGTQIGISRPDHYFRDSQVDFAYIIPDAPIKRPSGSRRVLTLNSTDIRRKVTLRVFRNARVVKRSGEIVSVDFADTLVNPDTGSQEEIINHIEVFYQGELERGDSGAAASIGSDIAGFLRGLDVSNQIAIISKARQAKRHAGKKNRDFTL